LRPRGLDPRRRILRVRQRDRRAPLDALLRLVAATELDEQVPRLGALAER
jgi:hypothetical protein